MKIICQVYKSRRRQEMYLYVDKALGLDEVPEELLAHFGEPEEVMQLLLTPQRKLARVEVEEVMDKISEQGFYLQMPPATDIFAARTGDL